MNRRHEQAMALADEYRRHVDDDETVLASNACRAIETLVGRWVAGRFWMPASVRARMADEVQS